MQSAPGITKAAFTARALLTGTPEGRTAYVDADLKDPEAILSAPE
ncbi:SAM-dependent methyltransferase, partial [Nocardia niwae]